MTSVGRSRTRIMVVGMALVIGMIGASSVSDPPVANLSNADLSNTDLPGANVEGQPTRAWLCRATPGRCLVNRIFSTTDV